MISIRNEINTSSSNYIYICITTTLHVQIIFAAAVGSVLRIPFLLSDLSLCVLNLCSAKSISAIRSQLVRVKS